MGAFRVGHGNFENSKLFEGLVILNKKKGKTRQPQSCLSSVLFHLVSSLLFSCLVSPLLLSLLSSCLRYSTVPVTCCSTPTLHVHNGLPTLVLQVLNTAPFRDHCATHSQRHCCHLHVTGPVCSMSLECIGSTRSRP